VNCKVCELAIALYLLVVTICKCEINPITSLQSQSLDNILDTFGKTGHVVETPIGQSGPDDSTALKPFFNPLNYYNMTTKRMLNRLHTPRTSGRLFCGLYSDAFNYWKRMGSNNRIISE
jgi:hypothetical protein